MAKEWLAYEAAKELLDVKSIKNEAVIDIGSKYPLFTHLVLKSNTKYLVDVLEAAPEVTAKEIEDNLRGSDDVKEDGDKSSKKKPGRPAKSASSGSKKEKEEVAEENPYAGKSAKELYAMCRERGLSVKMKQPASVYVNVLLNDDQESDDWEEEEQKEEEKPSKKKPGRPAKKKEPEETEDDDDWEI